MRSNWWSAEQDKVLLKHWDIWPSNKIATTMGKSYKSIVCRAYRLQLGPKEISQRKKYLKLSCQPNSKINKPNRLDLTQIFNDPTRIGLPLGDLKEQDCRWPVQSGLFCGSISMSGKSYCPYHHHRSISSQPALRLMPIGNRQNPV